MAMANAIRPSSSASGEAEEQAALLAVRRGRVTQRALEERAEHETDADGCSARADRGKTGTDHFRRLKIHL